MKEDNRDFFEKMRPWLKEHPQILALVPTMLGVFLVLTVIFDWDT